ncbi:MAG: hypothetical protein EXS32_13150 [Opitutus sp.]|nr:hypothetical protein [Opitutus sp.]
MAVAPVTPPEKIVRQKRTLTLLIGVLAVGAVLIVTLATKIPLPLRLFVAATDLVAAAVLWVAMRQASEKK